MVSVVTGQQSVEVTTPFGAVRGLRTALDHQSYVDTFFKIPYAKPPIGDLRFKVPEHPDAWSGVRDGTQFGPQCPQPIDTYVLPYQVFPQSEDCLFLNIYRPQVTDPDTRLPVMVWIHGGAFFMGTGNRFNWTQLAANGVVVVTVDYRLGPLGFLCTEDGESPGNYGLYDQVMALKWVRDVISAFNGNPTNVTIFGESAGGASVSLLVLSREARGLFQRAIMESGVSLSPWTMSYRGAFPEPKAQAVELSTRLGCDVTDSARMLQCLRTKDAQEITNVSIVMEQAVGTVPIFRPVAETTFGQFGFLVANPETILLNNWFSDVPTLRGFNHDEAALGWQDKNDDGFTLDEVKQKVQWLVKTYFSRTGFPVASDNVFQEAMDLYINQPGVSGDPRKMRDAVVQMYTDLEFSAPEMLELQLATQHNIQPQYLYRFTYRSQNRMTPKWQGVVHVDELPYVSGAPVGGIQALPNYVSSWTADDIRVSRDFMTMWSNFAKNGDPTPSPVDGAKWLPWTQNTSQLLNIGSTLRMISYPGTPQQAFWKRTLSHAHFGTTVGGSGIIG
ncbi:hypothetical protein V1264_023344 [Littorina saxatilis]